MELNNESYHLQSGAMYLLCPDDFHEYTISHENPVKLYNVQFSDIFFNDIQKALLLPTESSPVLVSSPEFCAGISAELKELVEAQNDQDFASNLLCECIVQKILIKYRQETQKLNISESGAKTATPTESLQKVLQYIRLNYQNPLSLQKAAEIANISPHYFSELFHRVTNETFQSYLQKLRLEHARKLLVVSELSILEICYSSGFNTVSHFNRAFKINYGQTPTEYRKNPAQTIRALGFEETP